MTDTRDDIETFLGAHETPGPPESLRDRTLRRARAALDRPPARDRWARLYASRPLRAGWTAAVLALIVANVLLSTASRRPRRDWIVEEAAGRVPGLREVVAVPRLREVYLSLDALADRRPAVVGRSLPESPRKEKGS